MENLEGKTLFITGASRGIGKAIALRAAKDGANIAVVAKTKIPNPKLPGTVYSAVDDIKSAGGNAIPCITDIRFEEQVQNAIDTTLNKFGGIDILINNASAINLSPTLDITMKRFDLMFSVNTRGTFLCSRLCLPHLKKSENPHILNLSPPLNMDPKWFKTNLAYTIAKYGMSMCVLGLAEEFKTDGIAVNALWPRTTIATAAVRNLLGGKTAVKHSRKPEIVAEAAYLILTKPSREITGNFFIDDEVLHENGIDNLEKYAVDPTKEPYFDFFL
ncbi:MAG: SDR family oxidoreductase [Promethearchaeota archaeon]|jgi:citronellol/citronellal dehydrogenase